MDTRLNYINGTWTASASGATRNVINPATGEVICLMTDSTPEDTKLAIAAAKTSFYKTREWRNLDVQERADKMNPDLYSCCYSSGCSGTRGQDS